MSDKNTSMEVKALAFIDRLATMLESDTPPGDQQVYLSATKLTRAAQQVANRVEITTEVSDEEFEAVMKEMDTNEKQ